MKNYQYIDTKNLKEFDIIKYNTDNQTNYKENFYTYLNKDTINVRNEILKLQNNKCKICNCEITETTGVTLDHQHKNKSDLLIENGNGLIRGVLCRGCNSLEGKIWNNSKRYKGLNTVNDRILFLENLIKYYKEDNYNIIHVTELPKEPDVSKQQFNRLIKELKLDVNYKRKLPVYPKSKKLNIQLKDLFNKYEISPYI